MSENVSAEEKYKIKTFEASTIPMSSALRSVKKRAVEWMNSAHSPSIKIISHSIIADDSPLVEFTILYSEEK